MELSQTSAFLLSLAIEGCAAALFVFMTRWSSPWRGALAAVVGTCVTHPIVWHGVTALEGIAGYWPSVLAAEFFAVAVETLAWRFIASTSLGRAFASALLVNAVSFAAGVAIQRLL